jgi:hypothetical protein
MVVRRWEEIVSGEVWCGSERRVRKKKRERKREKE